MRFHLQTFGCKSNQYESQAIREALQKNGHEESASPEQAQLLVVNTCGVTGRAGASCRNAIRKALRKNPALTPVITGCAVDIDEPWTKTMAEGGVLVPNAKKHALPGIIGALTENRPFPESEGDRFALAISSFQGHTRAFLKIQDGCDNCCSYCAIPRARGKPESGPVAAILDEAARLAENGYRELALTGINIGAYRGNGCGLAELAARIAATPGLARLRLGSVEPPYVDDALLETMTGNRVICPHVHIPLQSGDDGILRAMGRRYRAKEFLRIIEKIRNALPLPSITTDVIVGFPGEDESAFLKTYSLCREVGFSRLHVFPFSPRPGTPAAGMRRGAPDREIERRKRRLLELGGRMAEEYAAANVGLNERIIVETGARESRGLTDRYLRASIADSAMPKNEVCEVKIIGSNGGRLTAVGRAERPRPFA
ncbi:MAG: tRNA (N(6)-L-threonylcarbamoyladenosine(37)-C(2))-methylthiotransferase MtaB [Planctomycetota bacterium]|jgi:threonylcarbamoyladenosine tRNA methylthiotransferase MtaB|nr:tRNA (N(6)-L-threonylcarbamoyladenosine(37)-C(2))-methylthiotransferase MtaB [Planctomycetota bacterium]